MQHVYAGRIKAGDRRPNRSRAGGQDQLIVRERPLRSPYRTRTSLVRVSIASATWLGENGYAVTLDLFARAMRKTMPIGDFSAQKEREPADAEIRILISENHCDVDIGVDLTRPQCGADASVAAADDQ
jgi:hypothetical protein